MKAFELLAFLKFYKRSKTNFRRVLYDQILSLTSACNSVFLVNYVRLRAYHLKVQARPSMLSCEKVVCYVHQINGCIYCWSHIEIKTFSVNKIYCLKISLFLSFFMHSNIRSKNVWYLLSRFYKRLQKNVVQVKSISEI